ncbi:MAG: CpsD/CapB family tyrosine-protein kinase [Desulfotomaculum sp.]|nr:CpsD/CapB family tyrosine-protein kinase [Desulfotomaculum sp.]
MVNKKLVVLENPKSPVAEAYRTIRSNIQFSFLDSELKRLLVTSSGPSEGKSITSANLASVFAQSGRRVILLDCDMRKPTQHKLFNLPNIAGLTNALLGDAVIDEVLNDINDTMLQVITTGPIPPNPAEMLGSKKMKAFLQELESYADLIILDTPPVIAVTDAALLAGSVDGVVMVVAANKTQIDLAKKSKELLLNAKANIVGTVLNMVEEDSQDYYYYYYYTEGEKDRKKKKPTAAASF